MTIRLKHSALRSGPNLNEVSPQIIFIEAFSNQIIPIIVTALFSSNPSMDWTILLSQKAL